MAKIIIVGFNGKARAAHGVYDTKRTSVKEWVKGRADIIAGDHGIIMTPAGKLLADYKRTPSVWGPQYKWWF